MVVLLLAIVDRDALACRRLIQDAAEIDALRLPVFDRLAHVEFVDLADHLAERAEAELRHQLAHFLGDEEEEVDHVLRLAGEALAQHRVLRGDADRAGVQMALAHHDAAGGDQRRGGEAELVGAEQRADHHVAAGAQAAVDLHGDAAAQTVQHQRLLRLGQADLPRRTGMRQRGQRRWRRCRPRSRRSSHDPRAPWTRPRRPCRRRPRTPASPKSAPAGLAFFRSAMSCARSSIE